MNGDDFGVDLSMLKGNVCKWQITLIVLNISVTVFNYSQHWDRI